MDLFITGKIYRVDMMFMDWEGCDLEEKYDNFFPNDPETQSTLLFTLRYINNFWYFTFF